MASLTRRKARNKRIDVLSRRLGTAELAARFAVTASTIRRWIRGEVPKARLDALRQIWERHQAGRKAAKSRKRHKRGKRVQLPEPKTPDVVVKFSSERKLIKDSVETYDRIRERTKYLINNPDAWQKDKDFLKELERDVQRRADIRDRLETLKDRKIRKMLSSEADLEANARKLAREYLLPERYFYVLFFSP
jgi:hypothetical protein